MTINEYQKLAMTTLNPDLNTKDVLINSVMGLCGESGEAIDIVKKWLAQGHALDRQHLAEELGDIAWYLAEAATALEISLEDIFEANIEKLKKRYPEGFDTEKSLARPHGAPEKMELIIASNNKGKIKEYKDIFEPLGYQVFSQSEKNIHLEVEETGVTFEENAVLKAQAIYDLTHHCVISDDSGLEVEALNNEPGIYSARYKGLESEHERRMAIINGLQGSKNRNARFVTCICFIDESGEKHLFQGIWKGTIAYAEEGTNGFGYDPIFISEDGGGKTTASLPISFKETYSHRAKAVKHLMEYFQN